MSVICTNDLIKRLREIVYERQELPELIDAADRLEELEDECADCERSLVDKHSETYRLRRVVEQLKARLAIRSQVYKTLRQEIRDVCNQLSAVTAERDAAKQDLRDCYRPWTCKKKDDCVCKSQFNGEPDCGYCDEWEWRGIAAHRKESFQEVDLGPFEPVKASTKPKSTE